jgi:TatD DNase family protein
VPQFRLVDTHCHLDFNAFNEDRQAVIDRARQAGLARMLIPGVDLASCRAALAIAETYPEVFAAVGVHPTSLSTWDEGTLNELRLLAAHPKVVAIGEIGLDYHWDASPREEQQKTLRVQIELASELGLPVILHCREAFDDSLPLMHSWQAALREAGNPLADRPGVFHSFSGDLSLARQAVEAGFLIGITGPVTFRNAPELQTVVKEAPLSALLVETDAPFLAPQPRRGKRNEPAFVRYVAEKIAAIRGLPVQAIAQITTANANRLFNWEKLVD